MNGRKNSPDVKNANGFPIVRRGSGRHCCLDYTLCSKISYNIYFICKYSSSVPQRHPLEINEGVSGEQDYLNNIFNAYNIRIVCKIIKTPT